MEVPLLCSGRGPQGSGPVSPHQAEGWGLTRSGRRQLCCRGSPFPSAPMTVCRPEPPPTPARPPHHRMAPLTWHSFLWRVTLP